MKAQAARGTLVKGSAVNREYSFLLFNKRVLDQAMDLTNPLLERCKFLSIFKSNLDEFTEVRIGSLINDAAKHPEERDRITGLTAEEQLDAIFGLFPDYYKLTDQTFQFLREDLREKGLDVTKPGKLTVKQTLEAEKFFRTYILPRISPLVLDQKHPMISFWNLRTYMVLLLERNGREMYGVCSLSPGIERLYEMKSGKRRRVMTSEDLLYSFAQIAFPGYTVKEKALVRLTRNADFEATMEDADEEYGWDFSSYIRKKVEKRSAQDPVRLEMNAPSLRIRDFLCSQLRLERSRVFISHTYFDYKFLFRIGSFFSPEDRARLSWRPFRGSVDPLLKGSVMKAVEKKDFLLTYPFNSIDPLISLLEEASGDPTVTGIRITIYRLSSNSRICAALMKARDNGKEVTALTELCARFDEENNLHYANLLRDAGCTVYYGLDDWKVHSKIISIKREVDGEVRYITHIGTGNYNETTSKLYTDVNLLTADQEIGEDGETFFRSLALRNVEADYRRLLVSPLYLRKGLIAELEKEMEKGPEGLFRAKFNSLVDREFITKLIEASNKGVEIRLCVRGLCCLVPGIPGVSENISITSIVGRFLEHSRIYAFGRGDESRIWISSADLMTRNLSKRVEIAAPILSPELKEKISLQLETVLSDNVKARALGSDGIYRKVSSLEKALNSQEELLKREHAYEEGDD